MIKDPTMSGKENDSPPSCTAKIVQYFEKLQRFSFVEKLTVIPYTIFSLLIKRLNKNIVVSHDLFSDLGEEGLNITRSGENVLIDTTINSRPFKINVKRNSSDSLVYGQIILEEEYKYVVSLFEKNSWDFRTVVDAGANIGLGTLYFKAFFPESEIICLEPNPSTHKRLNKNVHLNNLINVECLEKGLWKSNQKLAGNFGFRDGQDWSFTLSEGEAGNNSIDCVGVKNIIELKNWSQIDLLKIDIEGAESALFESRESVMDWLPAVKVVVIEIHDEYDCRERIEKLLKEFNFSTEDHLDLTIGINTSL